MAIRVLRGSVRRQADFDIKDVNPITHVPHCFIPALFIAAENDDFITKSHSLSLHDAYAGDSNMIVVDGDHNSSRPRFMFDSVSIFLQACLHIPVEWQFQLHPSMNVMMPPWRYPGMPTNTSQSVTSPMSQQLNQMQKLNASAPASLERRRQSTGISPSRQSALVDDIDSDEYDVNDAVLAARSDDDDYCNDNDDDSDHNDDENDAGFEIDQEKLGMTSERQKEIQGSLCRMLGHDNVTAPESR